MTKLEKELTAHHAWLTAEVKKGEGSMKDMLIGKTAQCAGKEERITAENADVYVYAISRVPELDENPGANYIYGHLYGMRKALEQLEEQFPWLKD